MLRWFVTSLALLVTACATAPVAPPAPAPESAVAATQPEPATQPLPKDLRWVRNSAEYRAVLVQTYRLANVALKERTAGREPGSWAVAIDADETLIGNSQQSREVALASPEEYLLSAGERVSFRGEWDNWVDRREAPALPGARRFLEQVHAMGGKIAVVTNRREHHCPQTADNLRAQNMPFDVVLCRGEVSDKRPRWRSVEDGTASPDLPPLEIVMWVGDNIHDFPGLDQELRFAGPEALGEFGDRFFILPNPLYGSWEHNPPEGTERPGDG